MGIAHELITRGWTQGLTLRSTGEVCLLGAAIRAYGIEEVGTSRCWALLPSTVRDALCDATGIDDPLGGYAVGRWNDHDKRTFDEVLRVAKEADELLDAQ